MKRLSLPERVRAFNERLGIPKKVAEKYVEARAQSEADGPLEALRVEGNAVFLYAPIASEREYAYLKSWGEPSITARMLNEAMAKVTGEVLIRVNSPGGAATEGAAMGVAVDDRRKAGDRVLSQVDALAASAAAFLLFRTDEIAADPMAEIMIHDVWNSYYLAGNAAELREQVQLVLKDADTLDGMSEATASVIAKRINKEVALVRRWMAEEKFWAAPKALEDGVIDRLLESPAPNSESPAEEPQAEEQPPTDPSARMLFLSHRLANIRRRIA